MIIRDYKSLKSLIAEGRDPLITSDRMKPLNINPHYTNRDYNDPENMFGRIERHLFLAEGFKIIDNGFCLMVPRAIYNYSDRLQSWHRARWHRAYNYALVIGNPEKSAAFLEDFLSALLCENVALVHVVVGIDSRGWYYQVFGMEIR